MRPVSRGSAPVDQDGNPIVFAHWSDARDELIKRIGDYCSYCENALNSAIAVEHVQPKNAGARPDLALAWDNFLLGCEYCNPIKGMAPLALNDFFWPDSDNTFRAFAYDHDSPPRPADGLSAVDFATAARTIALTGIDRVPGHPQFSDRDRRHTKRKEAWGLALFTLQEYQTGRISEVSAALSAASRGFFSIWMFVFQHYPEVRRILIKAFRAADDCFDPAAEPLRRHGGRI